MGLKIAHVSDIHIRNLKYHNEYRDVFKDLYRKLEELKPDIVINTGDTAHTKTQISPEFVEMTSDHIRNVSYIAPYHILLGNHDMNLMNPDRQDAITPIVDSLKSDRVFLHKKSGLVHTIAHAKTKYNLWAFSLADVKNYPMRSSWDKYPDDVNIGMFHGSISSCITDMDWRMTHVEHDINIFDGLDFALLGDIHKQQFFRDKTVAYAGSLIQQNFAEEIDKGFLFWELGEKGDKHSVKPVFLKGGRKFFTVRLAEDLSVPDVDVEPGAHVRIIPPRSVTLVEQKDFEKDIKKKLKPHDVITLSPNNIGEQKIVVGKKSSDAKNLRQIVVQEKLIRDFLSESNLSDDVIAKIMELNKKYQIDIEQEDKGARNISWKISKLGWSNLFNYGENNVIDFLKLGGLTGIFAPNGSGKSNLVDIILETCFDATTKGINKNIFLINDNKETAVSIAEIVTNDSTYEVERKIEKIKYGQRSLDKVKEWGKTSVSFSLVDDAGDKQALVGTSRPETESAIRQRLGTFDDFMLTSLMAQWNPMDIISAKETKRKEIIFKILDLDIFGQKAVMAKDESKEYVKRLAEIQSDDTDEMITKYRSTVAARNDSILDMKQQVSELELEYRSLEDEILFLTSQKVKIDKLSVSDWSTKIVESKVELSKIDSRISEIEKKISDKKAEVLKIEKVEAKFDLKLHKEKDGLRKSLIEQTNKLLHDLRGRKIELDAHLEAAKDLGDLTCQSCGTKVSLKSSPTISFLEAEIEKLQNDVIVAKGDADILKDFSDRLENFEYFQNEKVGIKSKIDNLKLQHEVLLLELERTKSKILKLEEEKKNYEQMELDIKKNEGLDTQIHDVQSRKKLTSKKISSLQDQIVEEVRKLGLESGILEKLEAQLTEVKDLKNACLAYEHYIRAMGKDGIPYQVLTQKLPLINDEINKILSNVADFGVYLEHDAEEQSIRFYIQYGQYKGRLLELGSGAEKFLASIAIRNALLNISSLPKTNMLIIDEGFGKLDPKNLESIQKMFDYLRTVFDHILVISHLDSMKDMVDNIIEITNDDEGYAHVEIGG